MAYISVSKLTTVVSPDPLSPTLPTSSAMKTPDQQSPGPLASLVETAGILEIIKVDPNAPEPAVEGYIYVIPL